MADRSEIALIAEAAAQKTIVQVVGMIACRAAGIEGDALRAIAQTLANDASYLEAKNAGADDQEAIRRAFRDALIQGFEPIARLLDAKDTDVN